MSGYLGPYGLATLALAPHAEHGTLDRLLGAGANASEPRCLEYQLDCLRT
jgi:hypothetical protein